MIGQETKGTILFRASQSNFDSQYRDLSPFSTRARIHSIGISETSPLHSVFTYIQHIMNFSNSYSIPPTSIPRYLPLYRRLPTYRGYPYLTYDDLYTRYSPPNSPRLRMLCVQRSLSTKDLYQRYRETSSHPEERRSQNPPGIPASSPSQEIPGQQGETQAQNSAGISALPPPSPPPPKPRDFEALRANRPISPQPVRQPLSLRLPDPPIFTGTNSIPFDD